MRLLERYVLANLAPYTALGALLLTGALLGQQIGRLADAGGTIGMRVLVEVLPSILVFALPTGALVGTLTGYAKMSGDSEITALRAAGVSTWRIIAPAVLWGGTISLFTLWLNLEAAPSAVRRLHETLAAVALERVNSPAEPRSFNAELPGKVLYVRDGRAGQWGRIFIRSQERDGTIRLITARAGRVDLSGDDAELVLSDAVVTTLPRDWGDGKGPYTVERSAQLRVKLDTGRAALMRALGEERISYEEMSLGELRLASGGEAATIFHKRLALGIAPLVCAIFGGAVGLRVRRGGRGVGIFLSLVAMLFYYLLTLIGEQLGRSGQLPPAVGGWLATGVAFICSLLLLGRGRLWNVPWPSGRWVYPRRGSASTRSLSFGLLDRVILRSLATGFVGSALGLTGFFLIFTLFEMWRFATDEGRRRILWEYLLFLWPFSAYVLAPLAVLVAAIVTYGLMARRNETIAWWATGQSTYRLMAPGLCFAGLIGLFLWLAQEGPLPRLNRRQDMLRAQLRGVARAAQPTGRAWLASFDTRRIYSYDEYRDGRLTAPEIYFFDDEGVHLDAVLSGDWARYEGGGRWVVDRARLLLDEQVRVAEQAAFRGEEADVFKQVLNKPALLSSRELSEAIRVLERRGDRPPLAPLLVARQSKRAAPVAPLVMCLVAIPLALAFGRRSALIPLAGAIVIGLCFWAVTSLFQLLGEQQLLPPAVAGWAPTALFTAAGLYMLARART